MATVSPSNFKFVNASGDAGEVKSLSDADITLINNCLQDVENLKYTALSSLPAGTIIPFAGNVVPAGFLVCNGAAVSRTTYASLFAAIGTLYGAGDGSTTFALPDYRGRVLQGADDSHAAGTYIAAGLPNITGRVGHFGYKAWNETGENGAFKYTRQQLVGTFESGGNEDIYQFIEDFNATNSNSLYGGSSTVQPAAGSIQYLIKY